MGVGFITGRLCTDRLDKILDLCFEEASIESRDPIFILVPEKNSYEVEKKFSERLKNEKDPFFRIRVATFSSLSNIVFTNVGGLIEKKLSKSSRNMLIYKAIESVKNELNTIRVSDGVGIVNKILDLIIEFKQNNMDVDYVSEMTSKIEDEELRYRMEDYFKIYRAYEELLLDRYMDVEDELDLFSKNLDLFDGIKNATVFISEFTGFTPIQYNILEKLIVNSKNTYISLVTDLVNFNSRRGVFSKTNITFLKVNEICQKHGIKRLKDINLYEDGYYDNNYLRYLEKNINSYKIDAMAGCGDDIGRHIQITQFSNIYDEARYVADEIMRLVKNEGYRYSDITVAGRDVNMYSHVLNVLFEDYDIRYFIDKKFSAKFNPLVVFLISILKMKINNYSYESVFRYLKTGFSNIDLDEISKLENYVLENGIRGKAWFSDNWTNPILHNIDDEEEVDLSEINDIRDRMMYPIKRLEERLEGRKTVKTICTAIYEFIIDVGVDIRLSSMIEEFREAEEEGKILEYTQVWKIIMQVLDDLYDFIGNEYISVERFNSFLEAEFEGIEIGIVPPGRDEVKITSIDRMSSSNVKVLFLLGCMDGVFPANISETSIINNTDRENLLRIGVKFDSDFITKFYDEEFLVYKAFSSSKSKLYLSYYKSDFEGREMLRSPIIKKLYKMFPTIKEECFSNDISEIDILNGDYSREGLFNILENNFKSINSVDEPSESTLLWSVVYNYFLNDEVYSKRADMMDGGMNYTNSVLSLGDIFSSYLYGRGIFSVSKLEKYVSCPFSYFLKYGLRLKMKKKLEFSSLDSGIYNHKILDEFSKSLMNMNINWMDLDKSYIEKEVRTISSRLILSKKNYILSSSKKYFYMAERINKSLVDSIVLMVEQIKRDNFEPRGFEVEFGLYDGIDPIKYNLKNGREIVLEGKIDRVDICRADGIDYIKLIDYKSSTRDLDINKIFEGLQMQLFIYMRALLESKKSVDSSSKYQSGNFNYKPAALLYSRFNISDFTLKGSDDLKKYEADDIKEGIMKDNKLKGLVIKDSSVINNLDKTVSEYNKYSSILSIEVNKGGKIGSRTKGLYPEDFDVVNNYVFEKAKDICEKIYSGNIDILPFKYDDEVACRFCEYKSVCQFDISTGNDRYNIINKISKNNKLDDVLSKMKSILKSKDGKF